MERGIRKFLTFVISYIASKIFGKIILKPMYKWNPVITGTDRQKNLATLPRVFYKKTYGCFAGRRKKSGLNNEVTVLPY